MVSPLLLRSRRLQRLHQYFYSSFVNFCFPLCSDSFSCWNMTWNGLRVILVCQWSDLIKFPICNWSIFASFFPPKAIVASGVRNLVPSHPKPDPVEKKTTTKNQPRVDRHLPAGPRKHLQVLELREEAEKVARSNVRLGRQPSHLGKFVKRRK